MSNNESEDDFKCDMCGKHPYTLYEGWFKHPDSTNPFFKGTATSGLLQNIRVCLECLQKAIHNGTACAKEILK